MLKTRTVVGAICAVSMGVTVTACGGSSSSSSSTGSSGSSAAQAASGSCTPKHPNLPTIKHGTLSVAAYVSPPYTVQDGSQINGIDGLIVQAIAKMECLKYDATSVAGAALPSSVQSNRADMAIGGIYYSAQRAASFSLSIPMYTDGLALLSKNGVSTLEGLSNTTLGVIQGYLWNSEFQSALGSGKVKIYQTSAALVSDIKVGRVGAGAFTSTEATLRAKQEGLKAAVMVPTSKIAQSEAKSNVVLFMNKHSTQLTAAMNDDLRVLLANGTVARALQSNGVSPSLAAKSS
jgi:polar amino acid transport system substrate-binding protein